ncbi:hypothetical protein FVE85_8269 [Porphyridium purpureum]|uniref:DNA replication regulator SLD2 n=1 Tax=Porphyridium purpureum TaxID=35688 RepID=A0A5J4YMZ5_PORPP|nr:hypothetical protein FVE85_8269 [Porphyridium purpureum]|eukprot:POR1823..scf244_11
MEALKHSIQAWERSFASSHGGRQPVREDVTRAGACVLALYQEYAQLLGAAGIKQAEQRKHAQKDDDLGVAASRTAHLATDVPPIKRRAVARQKIGRQAEFVSEAEAEHSEYLHIRDFTYPEPKSKRAGVGSFAQFGILSEGETDQDAGKENTGAPVQAPSATHTEPESDTGQEAQVSRYPVHTKGRKKRRQMTARPRDAMPGFRKRGMAAAVSKRSTWKRR